MLWKEFWENYQVSEAGQVMSRHSGEWKTLKQKKSKSDKHGGFYMTVSLPGGHKKVHHLVWECFKGPRRKGYVINHIDGNRENCSLRNLEEITQKKNIENVIARGKFKLFGKVYEQTNRDLCQVQRPTEDEVQPSLQEPENLQEREVC